MGRSWVVILLAFLGLCRADSLTCDNTTLHEVSECRYPCPPERTCQNYRGPEPPCVPPSQPCKQQCVCADGYAKNQYGGTCVTLAQCDKCPGYNQYFACDGPYSENCSGSCHCATGYERDSNNTCVSTTPPPVVVQPPPPPPPVVILPPPPPPPIDYPPTTSCPPDPPLVCDNEHEVSACVYGCPPERTCENLNWPPLPCAPPGFPCTQKCICDDGYARNQDGKCVTLEQCNPPLVCNNETLHEVSACGYGCPPERTCQNRNWPPLSCAPPAFPCTQKCICGEGYVRNQDGGTCVTLEQCDQCGENEYFECDCEYSEDCEGHCYCLSGYTRDIDDKCVYVNPASPPKDFGPPAPEPEDQCGENAYFVWDGEYSEGHCYCFSGYTRDIDGKCVYVNPASPPKDSGPPDPEHEDLKCDLANLHEVPACRNPCPPEPTCQSLQQPQPTCGPESPHVCKPTCVCANGYVRTKDARHGGICVPNEQCDLKCDLASRHEVQGCIYPCPPERTCESLHQPEQTCQPETPHVCKPACLCADGYVRDARHGWICIPYEQCNICGINEYFACNGPYSPTCAGSCRCVAGFERDGNNTCVSTTPTPLNMKDLKCDLANLHEVPACLYPCLPELTCQSLQQPQPTCAPKSPNVCTPTCVCADGYVRTKDARHGGICVPNEQCDLKCDLASRHEVQGCIYPCPPERTCGSLHQPEQTCQPESPHVCKPTCLCADGYVRNKDAYHGGICVPYEQCNICGINEYFACNGPYSPTCAGSCRCVAGFERDGNNTCVSTTPTPSCHIYYPPPPPDAEPVEEPFEFAVFYNW